MKQNNTTNEILEKAGKEKLTGWLVCLFFFLVGGLLYLYNRVGMRKRRGGYNDLQCCYIKEWKWQY